MIRESEGRRLREKIEERTGIQIADIRFYAAGQNSHLYLVDLDDKRRMIGKILPQGIDSTGSADLEIEGWMLEYLNRQGKLSVPKVYWYDKTTILMDFIVGSGTVEATVETDAAEKLAALHSVQTRFFGLERDTAISSIIQPNHFELSWPVFFRDYRLSPLATAALEGGLIDASLMIKITRLGEKLDQYIGNTAKPGLVHGDLWPGNFILNGGKVAAFIDPAIYYADPEIELAAIYLYGTFGETFFKRYNEIRPIAPDFHDARCALYSLYPLLVELCRRQTQHVKRIEDIVNRFTG
ncbi:MAG: fructosamine kinase [Micavibrio sp.]|nr:fructosamine kinase [Micavibrio sp.]